MTFPVGSVVIDPQAEIRSQMRKALEQQRRVVYLCAGDHAFDDWPDTDELRWVDEAFSCDFCWRKGIGYYERLKEWHIAHPGARSFTPEFQAYEDQVQRQWQALPTLASVLAESEA